jgi:urease accessory protein
MRDGKPVIFTNLKRGDGLDRVIDWIRRDVLFESAASPARGR